MATIKVKELCEILRIPYQKYYQFSTEGILPKPDKGYVDCAEAVQKYIAHLKAKNTVDSTSSLTHERARLTKIQADRKALQFEKEKGKLVDVDEIMKVFLDVLGRINAKISSWPSKAAPLIVPVCKTPAEAQDVLDRLVEELKDEIRNWSTYNTSRSNNPSSHTERNSKASKTQRKRVGRQKQSVKS